MSSYSALLLKNNMGTLIDTIKSLEQFSGKLDLSAMKTELAESKKATLTIANEGKKVSKKQIIVNEISQMMDTMCLKNFLSIDMSFKTANKMVEQLSTIDIIQ